MSLALVKEEYCENCSRFEPKVDRHVVYYGANEMTETVVQCEHLGFCRGRVEYLRKEINKFERKRRNREEYQG